jgi:hypothetical protein
VVSVVVSVGSGILTNENFFIGWNISGYAFLYSEANWDNATIDGFNVGWSVSPYHTNWSTVPNMAVLADFTAPAGWATDWSGVTSSSFGSAEDFGSW